MSEDTINKKPQKKLRINTIVVLTIFTAIGYYLFFFVHNSNFKPVVAGKIYRSAQPSEENLQKWIEDYSIKTVINLRAKKPDEIEREQQVADRLGVTLIPIYLSGRRLITTSEFEKITQALEAAELPVLLHCKSGIDRAGIVSALAAFGIGGVDYDTARRQAFVPPGPWKRKDFSEIRADYIHDFAHISDILKLYENYCQKENINTNDWQQFKHWTIELKSLENEDIQYTSSHSYFPFLSGGKSFYPVHKLGSKVYSQFVLQLVIISVIVFFIYRYSVKKEP
ncbi:tyrosine-protein phosphatase [Planctomycetota bacterium]